MKFKKKISIIAVAIAIISAVLGVLIFNRLNQVNDFSKNIKANISLNKPIIFEKEQVSNDWSKIQTAQQTAIEQGIPENAYGVIKIPSINLDLPIFKGSNELTLSLGAATFQYDNAMAGTGNLVLAGHTTPYAGVLFTNLHEIEKGAKVTVETSEKTVTYQIDSVETTKVNYETINGQPENKILQLPADNEKAKITLVTCTAWNDNSTRLLVSGHLV